MYSEGMYVFGHNNINYMEVEQERKVVTCSASLLFLHAKRHMVWCIENMTVISFAG